MRKDSEALVRRATKGTADPPSKRKQILNAAIVVFSTRGYRETLVDHIAQEAGVAKGTLYLYFRSKEDMYLEAFRENMEELHQATVERMAEASGAWDKIKAFVAVLLEAAETRKEFLRIYLSEFAGAFATKSEWGPHLKDMLGSGSDLLREVFEEGIRAGEVRDIPAVQLVSMLHYMVAGIMSSRVTDIRLTDADLTAELIVDLLRTGLGPPEA